MRIRLTLDRRQRSSDPVRGIGVEVEPHYPRQMCRKSHSANCRKNRLHLFRRDRGSVGNTRIAAGRRLLAVAYSPIHLDQSSAQQRVVVEGIERLLAARPIERIGVGQRQFARRMLAPAK